MTALVEKPAKTRGRKKRFTILHTNDIRSAFIGIGPSSDDTPFTLNDDTTRQAIMDHLRALPARSTGTLPIIPIDERASEVRAIKAG
jgi:hypothetical protein